jgi:phage host-nuclease inhibitor protein Gam
MAVKSKRERVSARPLYTNLDQVDQAIGDAKEIDRQIAEIDADAESKIDKIKEEAKEKAKPLHEKRALLSKSIEDYCTFYRDSVFEDGKKTRQLVFGEVNFRKDPPSCQIIKGKWTIQASINAIKAVLPAPLKKLFIRSVETLNKEEILAYDARVLNPPKDQKPEDALQPVDWSSIGIQIVRDNEVFGWSYFETNATADTSEPQKDAA